MEMTVQLHRSCTKDSEPIHVQRANYTVYNGLNEGCHLGKLSSVYTFHKILIPEIHKNSYKAMRGIKSVFMKDDTCISNKFKKIRSESLNTTEIHVKTIALQLCISMGRLQ